jgi:hypothetical protein
MADSNRMQKVLTTEQRTAMEEIENIAESNPAAKTVPAEMDLDHAIQESMPWKEVTRKKDGKDMAVDKVDMTMKKVHVTLSIRTQPDASTFSPAKLHIDTLHEMHKFDESLIVFNANGDTKINIESSMSETGYKETFRPIEKSTSRGPSSISISHDIYLTAKANDCKEAIFPFLKKKSNLHVLESETRLGTFLCNWHSFWSKSRFYLARRTFRSANRDDEIGNQQHGSTTNWNHYRWESKNSSLLEYSNNWHQQTISNNIRCS